MGSKTFPTGKPHIWKDKHSRTIHCWKCASRNYNWVGTGYSPLKAYVNFIKLNNIWLRDDEPRSH